MKVIIAGGRDYKERSDHIREVKRLLSEWGATEVVSGLAKGADALGVRIGMQLGLPIAKFPANWNRHGKGAGHIRNRQMAEYADALIALPGSRGTENMIDQAKANGLKIAVIPHGPAPMIAKETP